MTWTDQDQAALQKAVQYLEVPGLAARVTNLIGTPIESGVKLLPNDWQASVGKAVEIALYKAMEAALFTMTDRHQQKSSDWVHMGLASASGAVGGFFGLAGLAVELPLTTTIMVRSVADIARSEGEDIGSHDTAMECMQVFALGSGKTESDDAAEAGYYLVRAALATAVSDAVSYLVKSTAAETTAPAIVRLITAIASRFGVQVTEKVLAQAVPVIGAFGGAGINAIFMDHYQDVARGHFTVRRLDRIYGKEEVELHYQRIYQSLILKKSRAPEPVQS